MAFPYLLKHKGVLVVNVDNVETHLRLVATKTYNNGTIKYYFHRMNQFVEKILDELEWQFKNRYSKNWLC